jgi:hypothetical protein
MGGPTRNPARQRRHGIYPTPPALEGYLVRSVHRLLQARFGWSAGLADPRVRLEVQARIADDPASPPYNTRIGNTIVGIPKNCNRRWRA